MGVETALDKWRQANDCTLRNSADRISPHVTYYHWSDCAGPAEIQFYQLTTGNHTWPGAPDSAPNRKTNKEVKASELIWEFFTNHELN